MSNIELVRSFEKSVNLSNAKFSQRLMDNPLKPFYLKFLLTVSGYQKNAIKTKAKTFWNEGMNVILPESGSLSIFCHGLIDEGLTRMVLEYLQPGMTFFDIVAHIGYFTLLGSLIVGSEGQVHSFEPTPGVFDILKRNVKGKKNVTLIDSPVFSEKKKIVINDYGIKFSGLNTIYNARVSKDMLPKMKYESYELESISIDDYVENNGIKPDFVKIDAECSEYHILIGMQKTIARFHPIISIEVGDGYVEGIPSSNQLLRFLTDRGYQPYEYVHGKILQHKIKDEPYKSDNILLLPC